MFNKIAATMLLGAALALAPVAAFAQMSISDGKTTTTTGGVAPADGMTPPTMPTGNEPVIGGQMKTVTSVKSCLEKLPPEEATEIRLRYSKPYQECQRRLHSQAVQKAKPASEEDMQKPAAAENPRNFVRVQKTTTPPKLPILGIKGSNIPEKSEKKPSNFNR